MLWLSTSRDREEAGRGMVEEGKGKGMLTMRVINAINAISSSSSSSSSSRQSFLWIWSTVLELQATVVLRNYCRVNRLPRKHLVFAI